MKASLDLPRGGLNVTQFGRRRIPLLVLVSLCLCGLALTVTPFADASFEPAGLFGASGNNESRLAESGDGVAVDDTTGDVYVADEAGNRIAVFDASGNFLQAWGWGVGNGADEYQRCGPEGEIAHPRCENHRGDGNSVGLNGEGTGQFDGPTAISIDQSTGDVYVLDGNRKHNLIQVFDASGERIIASFGEEASSNQESVSANPESIHEVNSDSIAVDSSGTIYVADQIVANPRENRLMMFRPEAPGGYEHYIYAGRSSDLAVGLEPEDVAVDAHGALYLGAAEVTERIYKLEPSESTTPVWEYRASSEVGSIAVDPETGNLFIYKGSNTNTFVELSSPDGKIIEEFKGIKKELSTHGLAFDPNAVLAPGRPDGILYAVDEEVEGGEGLIFARAPVSSPSIDSESVSDISASSASFEADVNPHGYDTRYSVQYGKANCSVEPSECIEAPIGGANLGTGQQDLTAAEAVSGLEPDTLYHYRFLATSKCNPGNPAEECPVVGPDATFRTFPASVVGLPDDRVYELVSPPDKDGEEVFPADPTPLGASCGECEPGNFGSARVAQSASSGDAIAYYGGPFSVTGGISSLNEYVAKRGAGGWENEDLVVSGGGEEQRFDAFSSDLSLGILAINGQAVSAEAPAGYSNLYRRDFSGDLEPLINNAPLDRAPDSSGGNNTFTITFAGISSDAHHVIFEANDSLTSATEAAPVAEDGGASKNNLYEWMGGQLRLVNVLPGNASSKAGATFGSGAELPHMGDDPDFSGAISEDGSRIFWSDESSGQVYVRMNGESTTEIPDSGRFLTASTDGSKVLLDDGHIYDLSTEKVSDLTAGMGEFLGILGTNEDLSRIYFVDTAVLTGSQTDGAGQVAENNKDNLYAWHEGATVFLGSLAPRDDSFEGVFTSGDWAASPSDRTAMVTANGRYLTFMSEASLTGYDNTDAVTDKPDFEVYEYDAESGRLTCASCNPSGERPQGQATLGLLKPGSGFLPQPHDLSDNGRVFFDSSDVLSPLDVNGLENVYEYEPDGLGTCERAEGCIFLISSGQGGSDSIFMDASLDGSNVFFTTREELVPQDVDGLVDLYDARVDGGFPALAAPVCTGTGCQGVPGTPPVFATPSSVTFAGVGNFATGSGKPAIKQKAVKCAKGRKLAHGKCVKQRRKVRRARKSNVKQARKGGIR